MRCGAPEVAECCFRDALKQAPGNAEISLYLATALCEQQRLWEAAAPARTAWLAEPRNVSYRECLRFVVANMEPQAESGALGWPSPEDETVMRLIAEGNARRNAGRLDQAEAACRRALAVLPLDPYVHNRLGALLCCAERYGESAPHFRVSAQAGLRPDDVVDFSRALLEQLRADCPPASAPAASRGRPVLFASCDAVYFQKFAFALAQSVSRNAGVDCVLHFHVVNPDRGVEAEMRRIRGSLPNACIELTEERTDVARFETPKTYYACARFLRLAEVLRTYRAPVVIVDMDALVIRDLGPLLIGLGDVDFAVPLVDRGRRDPGEILWAALVYFGCGAAALETAEFIASYIRHFLARGQDRWFLDQIALLAACAAIREGLLSARLRWLDQQLIWCGDSPQGGGDTALLWSFAHSIPQHARWLESEQFLAYGKVDFRRA